jgi:hypothetical protein
MVNPRSVEKFEQVFGPVYFVWLMDGPRLQSSRKINKYLVKLIIGQYVMAP